MISQYIHGRDNNYNLLRMICALFIAYYHCYFMMLGPAYLEGEHPYLYLSSQIALNVFFIISGFLIYQSYERRDDFISYFSARFLRIFPGLIAVAIVTALLFGALSTRMDLSAYYADSSLWRYIGRTSLLDPNQTIADVFSANTNPYEVNSAIWTLRYEFICYIALALVGVLGFLRTRKTVGVISAACVVGYLVIASFTNLLDIAFVNHMLHFGMSFVAGMFLYKYSDYVPLKGWVAVVLIAIAALLTFMTSIKTAELATIFATAYSVVYLAYIPQRLVRSYRALGDFSYGVYIYHYPLEQLTVQFFEPSSTLSLYLMVVPMTLIAAVLSWYIVEKPMLNRREWFTRHLHKVTGYTTKSRA